MEKPTYTAIDYNSLENKVIEGLVRDNYSKIKNTFYRVFNERSKNPNSPVGLCADLIGASNYKDDPDRILWRKVIKSRPGFRMNQEMFRQYGNGMRMNLRES